MATKVNNAFAEFMKDTVNLDADKTKLARASRDNLIENIKDFSSDVDFFQVYEDKILRFGSFERCTKIRPIDATLQLKSYTWNFDVVPCFYTNKDYYLIPDGAGNWKKTDPRIDNERTTNINQKHNGKLLELIRLVKYWNNRRVTLKIGSYLLECMILNRYENNQTPDNWWIDLQFGDTMKYLSSAILMDVNDPKGIQGNLNDFSWDNRCKISTALSKAYNKAAEAANLELEKKDQKGAITKWREVLGSSFPEYTED